MLESYYLIIYLSTQICFTMITVINQKKNLCQTSNVGIVVLLTYLEITVSEM